MTLAIQQAYYLQARNPSDNKTLIELAKEIDLDTKQFIQDLMSEKINNLLMEEIKTARHLKLNAFPSLLLVKNDQKIHVQHHYLDANIVLSNLQAAIAKQ